jgi:hypothetical protein
MRYPTPKAPLADAIAAIVGVVPPFEMDGVWHTRENPDLLADGLEGWCSEQICIGRYAPWATGCGILEAAEHLVETAIENGNLKKDEFDG